MHPDLYDVVYRQRERELEMELRRRLVRQERASAPARREPVLAGLVSRFRRPPQMSSVCCATA